MYHLTTAEDTKTQPDNNIISHHFNVISSFSAYFHDKQVEGLAQILVLDEEQLNGELMKEPKEIADILLDILKSQ